MSNKYQILSSHSPYFKNFTQHQFDILFSFFTSTVVPAGNYILHENDVSNSLYIIESGEVEIIKTSPDTHRVHQLNILKSGEAFGEVALLDKQKRSASARALNIVKLAILNNHDLYRLKKNHPDIYLLFVENLAGRIAHRLRVTNEHTIAALEEALNRSQEKTTLAIMTTYIVFSVILYAFAMSFLNFVTQKTVATAYVNVPTLLLFTIPVVAMILQSKIPLEFYGISTKNIKKVLLISFVYSFIIILIIISMIVITKTKFPHINLHLIFPIKEVQNPLWAFGFYMISASLQEIIVRCGIQSPLMYIIPTSRHKNFIVIMISAIMLAAFHGHLSFLMVLVVLPLSIIWSMLYIQIKNVFGLILSHFIVGFFVLFWLLSGL